MPIVTKKSLSHDRLTLKMKLGKSDISLRWSRSSDGMSASMDVPPAMLNRIGKAWSKIRDGGGSNASLGDILDKVIEVVTPCSSFEAAAVAMEKLEKLLA